jgi:hypothetical protein
MRIVRHLKQSVRFNPLDVLAGLAVLDVLPMIDASEELRPLGCKRNEYEFGLYS